MTYDEMRKHIVAISDYCSENDCSKCPFGEFGGNIACSWKHLVTVKVPWRKWRQRNDRE